MAAGQRKPISSPIQRSFSKVLARRRFARRLFGKLRPDELHQAIAWRLSRPDNIILPR